MENRYIQILRRIAHRLYHSLFPILYSRQKA